MRVSAMGFIVLGVGVMGCLWSLFPDWTAVLNLSCCHEEAISVFERLKRHWNIIMVALAVDLRALLVDAVTLKRLVFTTHDRDWLVFVDSFRA